MNLRLKVLNTIDQYEHILIFLLLANQENPLEVSGNR